MIDELKVFVIPAEENSLTQQLENSEDEEEVRKVIEEVAKLNARVIVSGAQLGKTALDICEDYKIMVLKIDSEPELLHFRHTTNAVRSLEFLGTRCSLGYADSIKLEENYGPRVSIRNKKSRVSSVLLGTDDQGVLNPFEERAVSKGVHAYKALSKDSRIVPGAGATEIEIARRLREYSKEKKGSDDERIIKKYAESFKFIPDTLAKNAYLYSTNLVAKLYGQHNKNNKVGIDLEEGVCKDVSTLKLWDLYTTKEKALQKATKVVCDILHDEYDDESLSLTRRILSPEELSKIFAKSEYELALQLERTMQKDPRFTHKGTWLGIRKVEDKIFALSRDGRLYCVRPSSKLHWTANVRESLHLSEDRLRDYYYEEKELSGMMVMYTHKPDLEFPEYPNQNAFSRKFGHAEGGYFEMSERKTKLFFDLETGDRVSTRNCPHSNVLSVLRSDLEYSWYKGKTRTSYTRVCSFNVFTLNRVGIKFHNISNEPVYQICKTVEWRPSHTENIKNLTWKGSIRDRDGQLVVHVDENIGNLICMLCLQLDKATDTRAVTDRLASIREVTGKSINFLKVFGSFIFNDSLVVFTDTWGNPLRQLLVKNRKTALKLIQGVLFGLKCFHEQKIVIGDLDLDNVFVGPDFFVKLSPISVRTELPRKFIKKGVTPPSQITDICKVGAIAFYCLTGTIYNQSNTDHNPSRLELSNILKKLSKDDLDLVKQLISGNITADEALKHNAFWSEKKTLDFIKDVVDNTDDAIKNRINGMKRNVFAHDPLDRSRSGTCRDWKSVFPQNFIKIMHEEGYGNKQEEKNSNRPKDNNSNRSNDTKIKQTTYSFDSVFDLLLIVRNVVTHVAKTRAKVRKGNYLNDTELQKMFNVNVKVWIYNKLRDEFPTLFNEIWKNLKPLLLKDRETTDFAEYY